jgi:hypothetical protein
MKFLKANVRLIKGFSAQFKEFPVITSLAIASIPLAWVYFLLTEAALFIHFISGEFADRLRYDEL